MAISDPRRWFAITVFALLLVAAGCADSDEPDTSVGAGSTGAAVTPTASEAPEDVILEDGKPPVFFPDKGPGELSTEDLEFIQDTYRQTNQLPVGDRVGSIVGYNRWTDVNGGEGDHAQIWDVYDYATDEQVGYKVDHYGFVAIDDIPDGSNHLEYLEEELLDPLNAYHAGQLDALDEAIAAGLIPAPGES